MTRISLARFSLIEAVLWRAQRLRETLLRFGGVHVAVSVMIAINFFTGIYLMIGRVLIFGEPATVEQIRSYLAREVWNGFAGRADVMLLSVALLLLLGMRQNNVTILWWAAAAAAALWGGLMVFMWIAYLSNHGVLVPTHFNGLISVGSGCFVCLRLSAETESASAPLTLSALLREAEHRRGVADRRRREQ